MTTFFLHFCSRFPIACLCLGILLSSPMLTSADDTRSAASGEGCSSELWRVMDALFFVDAGQVSDGVRFHLFMN